MDKLLPLNKGLFAIVDEADFEELSKWKWHAHWSASKQAYYVRRRVRIGGGKRKHIFLHRQLMCALSGLDVDHKNGNPLDNRRENLRICTRSQNSYNRGPQRDNTSGYKGVKWNKANSRWSSNIGVNGKRVFLGYFLDKKDAAAAYDRAAALHHGEFAQPNKVAA